MLSGTLRIQEYNSAHFLGHPRGLESAFGQRIDNLFVIFREIPDPRKN